MLLQAYFFAWRFGSAYRDTRRLAWDVLGLNRDLEARICRGAQDGELQESLLRRADAALYEAKAHGRNRVEPEERIEGSATRE